MHLATLASRLALATAILVVCPVADALSFGYANSTDASKWIINSGAGLKITMVRASCDIVSIQYKDQELQYNAKATHINSGLGRVTSTLQELDGEGEDQQTIQITCEQTGLTQYYFFRANENALYMGTYHSCDLKLPELRFLARLSRSTVSTGVPASTLDGTVGAIEAHDIYATVDNTTRSKFYSGVPFIEDQIHGVSGPKAGVYFVMSPMAYETSIGGPFYRDINNQCTTANELTFYMNSDHTRTEDYRFGFHGPYALVFTDGPAPISTEAVDFGFYQDLDLKGFVTDTGRGRIQGVISDPQNGLGNDTIVVGFKNAMAQYWTQLPPGELAYTSPLMKPGNYTITVYKKQLAVATASAEIRVAASRSRDIQDITVQFQPNPDALWTIGEWDGTPSGFLNANKIHEMHPSDDRMAPLLPINFTIGQDDAASFPLALFRGFNDPLTIIFNLTDTQALDVHTLRIGVTLAQNNGRTTVTVNDQWSGPAMATAAVKTRGITRGTTTGNYIVYEYTIPSSAFVTGDNKIVLGVTSGNTDPPEPFLHASVVFDALEFA
jgi:rhamnogalacturonan endolyase